MHPAMRPVAAILNHLLVQEPWAQGRLAAHHGKTACIDAGIAALSLTVGTDSLVESANDDATPAVTIHVKLSDLPLILANRERAVSYVKIEGDADFANTISQVSQSVRWDAEEDLSKLIGDIAATRLVAGVKSGLAAAQVAQQQLTENVVEYFLEEKPMLIRPHMMREFSAEVVRLRDDLERLAKRIEKLERR